ncbi:MAG: carboxypeptidase-like regulatory domain-containing protein [Gemmatimonadales bacterium]
MVRRRLTAALAAAVAVAVGMPRGAHAQRVVGIVRDSASRELLPGAAVTLLDANGAVLARVVSSAQGRFGASVGGARRLRIVRLGFRPRDVALPPLTQDVLRLEIAMSPLPTLLEPVAVRANPRCPRRDDRVAAFALLEQASAGLRASVVARDASPATLVRRVFDRALDGISDRIVHHSVRIDSSATTTASFAASHSAGEFVRRGFMRDSAGFQYFYGPDADVLLDDAFLTAYCFHIASDAARPNDIGLAFEAVDRRRGRVDVTGTLWVDTAARALRDVDFRFLGLPDEVMRLRPGGMTGFREVRPGIVLVDRWSLRLVASTLGTTYFSGGGGHTDSLMQSSYYVREAGGVLARATWPDGFRWRASLAGITGRAVRRDGSPAAGAALALVGAAYQKNGAIVPDATTPYRAVADSDGRFAFGDLLPGPYSVVVLEPRFRSLDYDLPTAQSFVVHGDTAIAADVHVPTAEEFVSAKCLEHANVSRADSVLVFGRVLTARGAPLFGVGLEAARNLLPAPSVWYRSGTFSGTGTDGLFIFCQKPMRGAFGDTLWLSARYEDRPIGNVHVPVTGKLTIVPIRAAPRIR